MRILVDLKEIKKIEKLVSIVSNSRVDLLEIKWGDFEVRISRKNETPVVVRGAPGETLEERTVPEFVEEPLAAPPAPAGESLGEEEEEDEEKYAHLHIVTSSIVGTFYKAPSPDATPFVQEGDVVRKGQVLCIIEAMKVMNEIESDAAGRVVKVFAENGHPVEYGEKLFALEPL